MVTSFAGFLATLRISMPFSNHLKARSWQAARIIADALRHRMQKVGHYFPVLWAVSQIGSPVRTIITLLSGDGENGISILNE